LEGNETRNAEKIANARERGQPFWEVTKNEGTRPWGKKAGRSGKTGAVVTGEGVRTLPGTGVSKEMVDASEENFQNAKIWGPEIETRPKK